MSSPNLLTVLQQLKSEKVKERQLGLASLRSTFEHDSAVRHLDKSGDGRAWLVLFQALFTAVANERAAFTKKGKESSSTSQAAHRRLNDVAAVVRWLTERSVDRMNKSVIRGLLAHLLQTMIHQGQLLAPVALDYIKALKCLVGWAPHSERLDADTWVQMVGMTFNIILGDPLRQSLDDGDDEREASTAPSTEMDDSESLYLDDGEDDDEKSPSGSSATHSKKRGRQDDSATLQTRPSTSKSHALQKSHKPRSVTLEQVESTSLLAVLLRSPSAPLLSPDFSYLPSAILRRLQRFLDRYPADTSLHHDYLLVLSSILSNLSLNKKHDVEIFARGAWDGLVGLWGTKNKGMKEGLVAVLRVLFPFVTADHDEIGAGRSWGDGIGRLWYLLDGEAESRWGVDGLSFESLRLEIVSDREEGEGACERGAFMASTFRAGWHFDAGQALAWAILELQADCAEKLFQLSESSHSVAPGKSTGKRTRLENPITSLLHSIRTQSAPNIRAYHLQILLFFIDRHWLVLHDSLQQEVISVLLQFLSSDIGVTQSWTFLCYAAIVYADSSFQPTPAPLPIHERRTRDAMTWDPIWTHAIRRANVPAVCRAACHTAHILLFHAKRLLTSQRVLLEIETLAKDLDVQGPAFPYDSVCVFLAQCLKVASQDVRLFRMQLEEKVLAWLVDNWKVEEGQIITNGGNSGMQTHMTKDTLVLLESICGFSKRSDLVLRILLPECPITETMVNEGKTKVIRNFLLNGRLPRFRKPSERCSTLAAGTAPPSGVNVSSSDLVQPRGRERRVSIFMLKSLEALVSEWDAIKEASTHPTVERARRSLDMVVTALSFESLLILNGMRSNRRVVQCACKLLLVVTPLLTDSRWTAEEKALVLLGLEPLTSTGDEEGGGRRWEAMLPPVTGTGIKAQTLRALISDEENRRRHVQALRREFQRVIWQSADVQDIFGPLVNTLRDILRCIVGHPDDSRTSRAMGGDDKDGFGPIRTTQQYPDFHQHAGDDNANRCIVEVCMTFLTVAPILQSSSGEPTRDKELIELILECDNKFFLAASALFDKVRQRTLNLNVNNLDMFLDKFAILLPQYQYAKSERLQLLVTHFLDSTLHLWTQPAVANSEVGDHIRSLCTWISGVLMSNKIQSWKTRDRILCFLDRYIAHDPFQAVWSQGQDGGETESLPAAMLPCLGADEDIRVRFRAAVANSRLFTIAHTVGQDPLLLYDAIKRSLTSNILDYEHVLTRLLSLGNTMVVSSAVRRGPYWHLLETCLHSNLYTRHVEAILSGVSERMGLSTVSVLFEAYASQIAYSIRQAGLDFLQFPSHLLGYRDRKECAVAAFRTFTPTNMLAGGPKPEAIAHGQKLFMNHCKVIQKSPSEGVGECFGDIVGFQIVTWIDEHTGYLESTKDLDRLLKTKTTPGDEIGTFYNLLQQNVDGIVAAILRTLGDQDFSQEGTIVKALMSIDESGKAAQAFRAIARYRRTEDFATHSPNLPTFDAATVLQALNWFTSRVPDLDKKAATYHILHELLADIQRSPLINEQLRLVNSISLWVSLHHEIFEESTLLHTLMHGATLLMAQSDLARVAQSILEWAFTYYSSTTKTDPHLPDVLVRICCLAHDYSLDTQDAVIANMGNDLLHWIDGQAFTLCKNATHRSQVSKALPAWPHKPSPELAEIYEDITSQSLSAVLGDVRISSNKFRLVRRLYDLAVPKACDEDEFAKTHFWRLKDCIPPVNQLQDEDIDAFAALLVLNKGHIDSFGSDQPNSQTIQARHRRKGNNGSNAGDDTSPEYTITSSLLTMLSSNAASQVHVAYRTLRHLMSVSNADTRQFRAWPSEHIAELEYLQTYRSTPGTRPLRDMNELLNLSSAVGPDVAREFPAWVAMITTLLSDLLASADPFYAQLDSILQSDITFAQQMLPVLVHTVLHAETPKEKGGNASCRTSLSHYFTSILTSKTASTSCLRSIVDIVLHLRCFRPPHFNDALAHDRWLDIDFTLLARSATTCGAYTTALLFLELASEYRSPGEAEDPIAEQILFDIYTHIDEPDGFYGIKTKDLRHFLIKRFHHEKQWEKAFRFHGAALEAGSMDPDETAGLLQSFHSFGFDHLAMESLHRPSIGAGSTLTTSNMSYRSGWRTETWDLPDQTEMQNTGASLYLALKAIYRERDPQTVNIVVRRALSEEMGRLRELGSENHTEIREVVQSLMCLSQVTNWKNSTIQNRLRSKDLDIRDWSNFIHLDSDFDFSDLENIMATRISLIRSVRQKEERGQIGSLVTPFARILIDLEKKCLLCLSEAARDARHIQIALNSVIRAQKLEKTPTFEVSQEFASVLWLQKEQKLAVQFLKDLVVRPNAEAPAQDAIDNKKKALLLARLGAWTSEACLEKPTDILAHYFDPATSLAGITNPDIFDPTCAAIYHQCAAFAERQYHAILKSPDAIRWKVYVDRKTEEIKRREDQLCRTQMGTKEHITLYNDQRKAKALLKEDQESFQQHNGARNAFLEQAIDMYSLCLQTSDDFDDDGAIRLCSLWFSNFENLHLQDKVRVALDRVPSRKFVFLAHQLSARLSKSQSVTQPKNQENLQSLVVRMCQEHPFHSLYQVYCLMPGGPNLSTTSRRQSSRQDPAASQTERSAAAGDIFDRLRGQTSSGERVRAVENICAASLQWAQYPIKDEKRYKGKPKFKVPDDLLIRKIENTRVPVVTVHTPLDPTLRYDNCIWIDRYANTFETAGGINLPKISLCYGSDGEKYKQLFKGEGNDDLRQDAVMEQVFYLVNIVLRRDRETRRRSLRVRDYKVIPLAAQAGVLEFVGNTSPLQGWLPQAHQRYRPNDMNPQEVSNQLSDKRKQSKSDVESLVALFLDIRKRFKPVLHHYFTERHKTPISWFAMRLKYSRSVATTSIVGHILGLGDRHVSNILIDNVTGEVVHIDLGIAFDQGKLLNIPERVPFRMTADIVDGMGASGTQGVFQRCAEETLRVLREGSEVIMTVLEVFKHDPLHSWTASELKIKRVQGTSTDSTAHTVRLGIGIDMTSGTADEAADRALSSVARKLDKALSVEYTVNELIAEATDPVNLATIFVGWGPHL